MKKAVFYVGALIVAGFVSLSILSQEKRQLPPLPPVPLKVDIPKPPVPPPPPPNLSSTPKPPKMPPPPPRPRVAHIQQK